MWKCFESCSYERLAPTNLKNYCRSSNFSSFRKTKEKFNEKQTYPIKSGEQFRGAAALKKRTKCQIALALFVFVDIKLRKVFTPPHCYSTCTDKRFTHTLDIVE